MKLLYCPFHYNSKKEDDLFKAFQKHFDVRLFSDREGFDPDYVFMISGCLPIEELEELRKTKAIITQFTSDPLYCPLEPVLRDEHYCDITLLNVGHLDMYKRFCKNVYWMPEVVAEWQIPEPKLMDGGKIVIVGRLYDSLPGGEVREEMIRFMAKRFPDKFEYYGGQIEGVNCKGEVSWEELPKVYNDAFIVIAIDNIFDVNGSCYQRQLGSIGTSCALSYVHKGIEKFPHLDVCIHFRNKYELHDWVQFLYKHPYLRNQIALQGHGFIKKNYTHDNWVKRYVDIVSKEKKVESPLYVSSTTL